MRPALHRRQHIVLRAALTVMMLVLPGCAADPQPGDAPDATADGGASADASPQQAFLQNLAAHCGDAFPGTLAFEPEGDPMLTGTEQLLVHFRECEPGEVRIPFHVEVEGSGDWNRSRTWYVMAVDSGLELRHDHREPDGSESTRTWYGGFTTAVGTATRQDFASVQRTDAAGVPVGWRIEIEPGAYYRYGTTRDGEYDWMIEFDLTSPVAGEIPAAWGAGDPPSRIPGRP